MSRQQVVWSWDERSRVWMEIARGSERDMTRTLARQRSAAARYLPSARFCMTPVSQPPTEEPASASYQDVCRDSNPIISADPKEERPT